MSFLFGGKQKTPAELMKEYKRNIDRSVREIEKERNNLQKQETKVEILKSQPCSQTATAEFYQTDFGEHSTDHQRYQESGQGWPDGCGENYGERFGAHAAAGDHVVWHE